VIEELIPGRDGEVRLVRLRTASGVLLWPIQRIYPLEMHDEELRRPDQMSAKIAQETQETVTSLEKDSGSKGVTGQTRSGRENKTSFTVLYVIVVFLEGILFFALLLSTGLSRGVRYDS
jgi:hypothetical protein